MFIGITQKLQEKLQEIRNKRKCSWTEAIESLTLADEVEEQLEKIKCKNFSETGCCKIEDDKKCEILSKEECPEFEKA